MEKWAGEREDPRMSLRFLTRVTKIIELSFTELMKLWEKWGNQGLYLGHMNLKCQLDIILAGTEPKVRTYV